MLVPSPWLGGPVGGNFFKIAATADFRQSQSVRTAATRQRAATGLRPSVRFSSTPATPSFTGTPKTETAGLRWRTASAHRSTITRPPSASPSGCRRRISTATVNPFKWWRTPFAPPELGGTARPAGHSPDHYRDNPQRHRCGGRTSVGAGARGGLPRLVVTVDGAPTNYGLHLRGSVPHLPVVGPVAGFRAGASRGPTSRPAAAVCRPRLNGRTPAAPGPPAPIPVRSRRAPGITTTVQTTPMASGSNAPIPGASRG